MKKLSSIKIWFLMFSLLILVSACTIEPLRNDKREVIKDAPDWVNKGSRLDTEKTARIFYGVSFALPQGDLGLQKSIADDASAKEVEKVLLTYLDAVSNDYMTSTRTSERSGNKPAVYREIDSTVPSQVAEGIQHRIDEAIARQYKDKDKNQISPKLKEEISQRVKDSMVRQTQNTIAYNTDFYYQLEDEISRQILGRAAQQLKNTVAVHLSAVKIMDTWRDSKTKTVWSLSALELKSVKNSMSTIKDLNVDLKAYFDGNADNIFDGMIRDRDSIDPFYFFK
ncbi:MAG: hypothetical protein ACOH1I_09705 [Gallionellaceae bacterium]|jgi:hypothetical protein